MKDLKVLSCHLEQRTVCICRGFYTHRHAGFLMEMEHLVTRHQVSVQPKLLITLSNT